MPEKESKESDVVALLKLPDDSQQCPSRWRQIAKDKTLFNVLHRAVEDKALPPVSGLLDEWRDWCAASGRMVQWEIAAGLVWCAEQAAKAPATLKASPSAEGLEAYRKGVELERCCFAIRSERYVPESLRDWAWGCIRTFLNVPARGRVLHIPAVAWRPAENEGFMLTLRLELMEGGTGGVLHHPEDAFVTIVDEGFNDSMRDAWQAACKLAAEKGAPLHCDARWRLLTGWSWDKSKRDDLVPAEVANDTSASGAAARGWWYALSNKVPDEEIVVLAQSDAVGGLTPVTGITAKVAAIAASERFDTIAVTTENYREAVEAVKKLGREQTLRVVDIACQKQPSVATPASSA
jgi:hypothetical protein